ncbi:MAG: hypothetical protein CM15mP72_2570 [Pelagibacteraceae bacterium]|nr:MAG: hypothetical protein CM15mP72_2570 [Pelagibacteraceae bacterium]
MIVIYTSDIYKKNYFIIVKDKFNRIDRLPPYIFGEINKLKAKLRKNGKDIIDFGMGNPRYAYTKTH